MSRLLAICFLVSIMVLAIDNSANAAFVAVDGITDIHLYETVDNTPNGTPSEIGPVVPIIFPDPPGFQTTFAVFLESASNDHSIANWSDVVKLDYILLDGGVVPIGTTYVGDGVLFAFLQAQLFSDPAFGTISNDVQNSNSVAWYQEDSSGVSSFFFDDFHIFVHSDPPEAVPEPSTFLLLGAGLAGIGFLRRKMKA